MRTGIGSATTRPPRHRSDAQALYDQGLALLSSRLRWIECRTSFNAGTEARSEAGARAGTASSLAYIELNSVRRGARQAIAAARALHRRLLDHDHPPHVEPAFIAGWPREIRPGTRRNRQPIARLDRRSAGRFRPTPSSCCCAALRSRRVSRADRGARLRGRIRFRITSRRLEGGAGAFRPHHFLTRTSCENAGRREADEHGRHSRMLAAGHLPHAWHMHGPQLRRAGTRSSRRFADSRRPTAAARLPGARKNRRPSSLHLEHNLGPAGGVGSVTPAR